jgi:hypothetical protein
MAGPGIELAEKAVNFLPDLFATGEAVPVDANNSNQVQALVDRNAEVLRGIGNAVNQQGFNIRLEFLQDGISLRNGIPMLQG